jgi:hypothetical protein
VLAKIGQQVQTGDVPQTVLDAFDYVKSHLQSGGKQVEDAYQTLKKHADKFSEAIVPKLHAEEAISQAAPDITDDELLRAFKNPKADLSVLSPDEQARLVKLTANMQPAPDQNWRQAVGKGQVIFSNKVLSGATENAPTVGGAIGGMVGGAVAGPPGAVGGAALGGAAGSLAKAAIQRPQEALAHPLETAGYALANAAGQGAAEGVGQAVAKGIPAAATAVYRGYLKPSLAAASIHNADAVVDTAIKEALPISRSGAEKGQALISKLKDQVTAIQKNSPNLTDLHQVADELRMWATKTFFKPGVPTSDFDAALKVADSIDKHASLGLQAGAASIPVDQTFAQGIKSGLQQTGANASILDSAATKQANEAGGHFMRTAMEKATPEIAGLNARESKLIPAVEAISRAVQRDSNTYQDFRGVRGILSTAVGGEEYKRTGDPWGAAVAAAGMYAGTKPAVISRAAIVASRLGKMSGIAPASAARVALAVVQGQMNQSEQTPEQPASNVVQVGPYRVEPQ